MDHNQIAKQSYSLPCEILTCKKQKILHVPSYPLCQDIIVITCKIIMIYLVWPHLGVNTKSLWYTNKGVHMINLPMLYFCDKFRTWILAIQFDFDDT
jgi:hypothetical protein